jgi:hypothetical protein
MGCRVGTLCDVFLLIVGILPEGDVDIQFHRCSEQNIAVVMKVTVEKILST